MAEVKISLKGESEERSKDAFNFTNFIIESFANQENIHESRFTKQHGVSCQEEGNVLYRVGTA